MNLKKPVSLVKNVLRLFIALWFLFGWVMHVYLVSTNSEGYRPFGSSALIPGYTKLWNDFVMPNILLFVILLIIFEVTVGCLISSKGKWVKIGSVFSLFFCVFLIQMGLSFPTIDPWVDFAGNRLPNLVFLLLTIPLFWGNFEKSLPEVIKGWFSKKK